jgi:hypothetical protein
MAYPLFNLKIRAIIASLVNIVPLLEYAKDAGKA